MGPDPTETARVMLDMVRKVIKDDHNGAFALMSTLDPEEMIHLMILQAAALADFLTFVHGDAATVLQYIDRTEVANNRGDI